ncbi:MAG: CAP domain-containing protein [Polaromonas sp.]|nr:CAP domain-containing protein [Polaromonas sp.]
MRTRKCRCGAFQMIWPLTINLTKSTSSNRWCAIGERASAAGYNYGSVGENVAAGQSSVSQVVADWVNSPSHCANIMTASFFDMAVSCKYNPSATYQYYWTLTFGNR